MFTGIVEEMGTLERVISKNNLSVLVIRADKVLKGAHVGTSIAVNGACLTVTGVRGKCLSFDVMLETLRKTTLGGLKPGDKVNLERALKANARIDGHFVSGHVDGVASIASIITSENYIEFHIRPPRALMKYLAPKGSVSIDGVSLTIGEVRATDFTVYLIPFTLKVTTLGGMRQKDRVNVETDILAKYVLQNRGSAYYSHGIHGCHVGKG